MTVFIEFYGLPGCGKSTVSHMIAKKLRLRGETVIEPTYDLDHKYSRGIRKTIKFVKLVRFVVFNPGRYKRLTRLIKANGYRGLEIVSQAANIAPKLLTYEKATAHYVIFDEGLTQSAISLCQGEKNTVQNEAVLRSLCKQRTVQKFYIKVDVETALERMSKRDRHESRIEKTKNAGEQREALRTFEKQCEEIDSRLIVEEIDKDEIVSFIMMQL